MSNNSEKIVSYLAKTSGRDKVLRCIQFFVRFLKGFLLKFRERKGNESKYEDLIKRFDAISSNFSLTRRLLRFGRTFGFTLNFLKLIKEYKFSNTNDYFDKNAHFFLYVLPKGISQLLTIIQFHLDHYIYLHKIKVIDAPKSISNFINLISDYSWVVDLIFSMWYELFEIYLLNKKKKHINSKRNGEEVPERNDDIIKQTTTIDLKIKDLKLDICKMAFDFPVAVSYCDEKLLHIMWVGLTGTMASLIGAYQMWS